MTKWHLAAVFVGTVVGGFAIVEGIKAAKQFAHENEVVESALVAENQVQEVEVSCRYRGYCYGHKMDGNFGYRFGTCKGRRLERQWYNEYEHVRRNGNQFFQKDVLKAEALGECSK